MKRFLSVRNRIKQLGEPRDRRLLQDTICKFQKNTHLPYGTRSTSKKKKNSPTFFLALKYSLLLKKKNDILKDIHIIIRSWGGVSNLNDVSHVYVHTLLRMDNNSFSDIFSPQKREKCLK